MVTHPRKLKKYIFFFFQTFNTTENESFDHYHISMSGKHTISIGIRGLVYRDVSNNSSSAIGYRTESCSDFINSFTVKNSISFSDFKELVVNAYVEKGCEVDLDGKLFTAVSKRSCNMVEVTNGDFLRDRLTSARKSNSMLQCGMGAVNNENSTSDPLLPAISGQNLPPFFHLDANVTGKGSAKASTDVAICVKNFIEALYWNEKSPFFHGFTKFHFGILYQQFVDLEQKGLSVVTDYGAEIYPPVSDWDSFHPDGHWRSDYTVLHAYNTKMCRGIINNFNSTI